MEIISLILAQFLTIFTVCDTYKENSIKAGGRQKRGVSERYVLSSPNMKLPYDVQNFLKNGENKEMLFTLFLRALTEDKYRPGRKIIFSGKHHCTKVTENEVMLFPSMTSNHEQGDTKLIALDIAAGIPSGDYVMVRSPSGDNDILVLFVAREFKTFMFLSIMEKATREK